MSSLINRNRFFEEFFRDFPLGYVARPLHGDPLPSPDKIKIDVKTNDKSFTVHAEMPGLNKDDIHVTVEGNLLTIEAEVKQYDANADDGQVVHSERYYGAIARTISLPAPVSASGVKAKYENGILTLNLPKLVEGGVKKIAVG